MAKPKFCFGMATFENVRGCRNTVNALRMNLPVDILEQSEILIVDNSPQSIQGLKTKALVSHWAAGIRSRKLTRHPLAVRYVEMAEPKGTTQTRNRIFQESQAEFTFCMDDHIEFFQADKNPGGLHSVEHATKFFDENPDFNGLIQGPMMAETLEGFSTSFADQFHEGMHGTWHADDKAYKDEPFEIWAQGLGLFACRTDTWLGFNPHFREFGGEECYIHEKYRQAGRVTLCIPGMRWLHEFKDKEIEPIKYPVGTLAKVRNLVLGSLEVGWSLKRIHSHFVEGKNEPPYGNFPMSQAGGRVDPRDWEQLISCPIQYPPARHDMPCGSCPVSNVHPSQQTAATQPQPSKVKVMETDPNKSKLENRYAFEVKQGNPWSVLLPFVRAIAAESKTVVEYSQQCSGVSFALLAGKPESYQAIFKTSGTPERFLSMRAAEEKIPFKVGGSLSSAGLLCINGFTTASEIFNPQEGQESLLKSASSMFDRIVILGVGANKHFQANKQETKAPGLVPALQEFLKRNMEWNTVGSVMEGYGYVLISKRPEDKRPIETGLATQVFKFLKAKTTMKLKGQSYVSDESAQKRLDVCAMCEYRAADRCSLCGCFLPADPMGGPGRAFYPAEALGTRTGCPIEKWPEMSELTVIQDGEKEPPPPVEPKK